MEKFTHSEETGLLICLQAGGLATECRRAIAAVNGEIAQAYLASTDKEESPRCGNTAHKSPSFQLVPTPAISSNMWDCHI